MQIEDDDLPERMPDMQLGDEWPDVVLGIVSVIVTVSTLFIAAHFVIKYW